MDVSNSGAGTLNWTATIPDSVDWARIAGGASGANSGTIQIEIDANPGAAREFELTVSGGSAGSRAVTVSQADGRPAIELTAESTELAGVGGLVSLQVRNAGIVPMQWSVSLPDELQDNSLAWAYIRDGESGADAGEIAIRYALNGGANRELVVTVTSPEAINSPQSLTLSQDWFGSPACTFEEARTEILDLMKRWYYFNDEGAQKRRYERLVVEDYSSLDSMLEDLRTPFRDLFFSNWTTAEISDALVGGQSVGFGFNGRLIVGFPDLNPLRYEVTDVYADSPAAGANLERGDWIVGVNGKAVTELAAAPHFHDELGADEEGLSVTFEVEKQSGARRTFSMAKALVNFPAVPAEHVRTFDTDAGKVGYLHVRGLWGDANMRLLDEFADLNAAGVKKLIVDMRYSAGGFAPVGHGLATLIGGPELYENNTQTVLSKTLHNELLRSEGRDSTTYFGCGAFPTTEMATRCENASSIRGLENVVFITSISTISPSEMVIAALQPFENVATVGLQTIGKPVGQYGLPFCLADASDSDTRKADLWPVSFAIVNAEGYGDYYGGIQVTDGCQVFEDDLSRHLGIRRSLGSRRRCATWKPEAAARPRPRKRRRSANRPG